MSAPTDPGTRAGCERCAGSASDPLATWLFLLAWLPSPFDRLLFLGRPRARRPSGRESW